MLRPKYASASPFTDGLTDTDGYGRIDFVYGSPKAVGAENNSPPEE